MRLDCGRLFIPFLARHSHTHPYRSPILAIEKRRGSRVCRKKMYSRRKGSSRLIRSDHGGDQPPIDP